VPREEDTSSSTAGGVGPQWLATSLVTTNSMVARGCWAVANWLRSRGCWTIAWPPPPHLRSPHDLSGADLRRANLRRATLNGANLNGATLHHADLRGAKCDNATNGRTSRVGTGRSARNKGTYGTPIQPLINPTTVEKAYETAYG
jgi:Pentapeptide repeats (8 copies)